MIGNVLDKGGTGTICEMVVKPDTGERHGDKAGEMPDEEGYKSAYDTAKRSAKGGGKLSGAWTWEGLGEGKEFEEGGFGNFEVWRSIVDITLEHKGDVSLGTTE